MTKLTRHTVQGVTLHGDMHRPGGVTFAFTERTGGVSEGSLSSLNLGDRVGDRAELVAKNRRRACDALGFGHLTDRLLCPRQVHGTGIVVVSDASEKALEAARLEGRAGADAIVCCVPNVPALICVADCVPVVLVCDGAFAVIHSGWRGSYDEIAGLALDALVGVASCSPDDVLAFVGPHIQACDYEVSEELLDRFTMRFGSQAAFDGHKLSLAHCITKTLMERGVAAHHIAVSTHSTASQPDCFFSFRASSGACGRQGALACLVGED